MGATPKLGLRYPETTDPADVPTDLHELATDVEAAFGGTRYRGRLTAAQFGALTGLQDGDVVDLIADATAGVIWRFRYNSAGSTYKWEFVGGPPLQANETAAATVSSASYLVDAASPALTLPRGGDYECAFASRVYFGGTVSWTAYATVKLGAAAPADSESGVASGPSPGGVFVSYYVMRTLRLAGRGSGDVLTQAHRVVGGQAAGFDNRFLRVTPVRIS